MDTSSVVEVVETTDWTVLAELLQQTNTWLQLTFCVGLVLVGAVIGLGVALVMGKVFK